MNFGMFTSWEGSQKLFFIWIALSLAKSCCSLHLTNMSAPVLQDPRRDMKLHCRFDMGGEELYAVKWYKDDHEFFRYTPAAAISITQYPVSGVQVDKQHSKCTSESCDLVLKGLSRPQSSGAYRCEVSTEAPAFRLASQTHNVTIAGCKSEWKNLRPTKILPLHPRIMTCDGGKIYHGDLILGVIAEDPPKIEELADTYRTGDLLVAKCTSGLGDPKPTLTWYVNKQPVTSKSSVREETVSIASEPNHQSSRINLLRTTSHLTLTLDKKITQNLAKTIIEISCESSTEGISTAVAGSLTSTKVIMVLDQNQIVNNQKLHSPFSGSLKNSHQISVVFSVLVFLKCC